MRFILGLIVAVLAPITSHACVHILVDSESPYNGLIQLACSSEEGPFCIVDEQSKTLTVAGTPMPEVAGRSVEDLLSIALQMKNKGKCKTVIDTGYHHAHAI